MTTETPRQVLSMRATKLEALMSGVVFVQQYRDGGKISLTYTDGTAEISASDGRGLSSFGSIFAAVAFVQGHRPNTSTVDADDLGPETMSETEGE